MKYSQFFVSPLAFNIYYALKKNDTQVKSMEELKSEFIWEIKFQDAFNELLIKELVDYDSVNNRISVIN
jgi:hypothetical protein